MANQLKQCLLLKHFPTFFLESSSASCSSSPPLKGPLLSALWGLSCITFVIIRGMSNTYGVRYIQRNYNLYDEKNGCEAEYIDYPAIVLGPTDKFVISRY